MRQHPDYCAATGKTRYENKCSADQVIRRFKITSRRQYIPKRAYHCKECGGWHLTSQSKHELE